MIPIVAIPVYLLIIHRAGKLKNLFVFPGTEATPEFVKNLKPNIIVNAACSGPLLPPIAGLHENLGKEGSKVYSILDMIENINSYPDDMTGKKVAVIGGGAVGLDVVEFFAPRGAEVSIVEMLPAIGNGIDPVSKVGTFAIMEKYGVRQMTKTALKEVRPNSFYVETPKTWVFIKSVYPSKEAGQSDMSGFFAYTLSLR